MGIHVCIETSCSTRPTPWAGVEHKALGSACTVARLHQRVVWRWARLWRRSQNGERPREEVAPEAKDLPRAGRGPFLVGVPKRRIHRTAVETEPAGAATAHQRSISGMHPKRSGMRVVVGRADRRIVVSVSRSHHGRPDAMRAYKTRKRKKKNPKNETTIKMSRWDEIKLIVT